MALLTKNKRSQFTVLGVIIIILLLNALAFAGLDLQNNSGNSIIYALKTSGVIYLAFFIFSVIAILINRPTWVKSFFFALLTFMTAHIILNLYYLITDKKIIDNGQAILSDAFLIWVVSVLVFSLWYWIVDRDGPVAREDEADLTRYDLLFPQYQSKIPGWTNWHPKFFDYVYFSFFTSSSFAPADTLPLTKRVKFLMVLETTISLIIIGMVASRAISLVQ